MHARSWINLPTSGDFYSPRIKPAASVRGHKETVYYLDICYTVILFNLYKYMQQPINKDLIIRQFQKLQWPKAKHIAKQIIENKILNQKNLLMYYKPYQKRTGEDYQEYLDIIGELDKVIDKDLPPNFTKQYLFLYEAKASREYWRGVDILVRDHIEFGGRGKDTPFNKLLNIGYHYLSKKVEKAIISVGLWPEIGILHSYRRRNKPLVYDLMELFRQSFIDMVLISFCRNKKFQIVDIEDEVISEYVYQIKVEWSQANHQNSHEKNGVIRSEIEKLKVFIVKGIDPRLYKWIYWK